MVGLMHFIEEIEGADEVEGDFLQFSVGKGTNHVHSIVPELLMFRVDGVDHVHHQFVEVKDGPVNGHVVVFHHLGQILNGV